MRRTPNNIDIFEDRAEVILTNRQKQESGRAIIDIDDIDKISKNRWYLHKKQQRAYTFIVGRKWVSMHSFIVGIKTNQQIMIDHINRNSLDNRKINLRVCTKRQNQCNTKDRVTNTTGYRGVYPRPGSSTWYVRINFCGKTLHIGSFRNIKEAAFAYNNAALEYHGDFASLNKVF